MKKEKTIGELFQEIDNRLTSMKNTAASNDIKKKVMDRGKPSKKVIEMEQGKDGKFRRK